MEMVRNLFRKETKALFFTVPNDKKNLILFSILLMLFMAFPLFPAAAQDPQEPKEVDASSLTQGTEWLLDNYSEKNITLKLENAQDQSLELTNIRGREKNLTVEGPGTLTIIGGENIGTGINVNSFTSTENVNLVIKNCYEGGISAITGDIDIYGGVEMILSTDQNGMFSKAGNIYLHSASNVEITAGGKMKALNAKKDLKIDGDLKVSVNSVYNGGSVYLIYADTGNITVNGNVTISGATCSVKGNYWAICANINNTGAVIVNGTADVTFPGYAINAGGDLTVNGTVYAANSFETPRYSLHSQKGNITIAGKYFRSGDKGANGITTTAGEINITGEATIYSPSCINSPSAVVISGKLNATQNETPASVSESDKKAAINVYNGKIKIEGNAKVTVNALFPPAGKNAIEAGSGTVEITGGTVNVETSAKNAINANTVSISGGTVTAKTTGQEGHGIKAVTVSISGGTVITEGPNNGIRPTDTITISGRDTSVSAKATDMENDDMTGIFAPYGIGINRDDELGIIRPVGGYCENDTCKYILDSQGKRAKEVLIRRCDHIISYDKTVTYNPDGIIIPVEGMFTITGGGTPTYTVTPGTGAGTYSTDSGKLSVTKTGTFKVTVNVPATEDYSGATASATLTVNNADPSFTVTMQGWTWGQPENDPAWTGTKGDAAITYIYYTDADCSSQTTVEKDGAGSAGGKPAYAGIYYVRGSVPGTDVYNEFTSEAASFSITPGTMSVTAEGYTGTYDGLSHGISVTVTDPTDAVIAYRVAAEGDYSLTENPTYPVGEHTVYYQVTNRNYTAVTGSQTVNIAQKPLKVIANNKEITYGDAPANAGLSYEGFLDGVDDNVLEGTAVYDYGGYVQYGDAKDYEITPSGLTSQYYDIEFVPGTLTVKPKPVGLLWTNISLPYNGNEQGPDAAVDPDDLVNGDTVGVEVTGKQKDAGTGYIATAGALTGEKKDNYSLPDDNTHTFEITKIDYTGTKTTEVNVWSDQETKGVTAALPALPEGAAYAENGTAGGTSPDLISGTPSVSGGILTFDTTSRPADTQAEITVAVSGGKNYNDYEVIVTVTAGDKGEAGVSIDGGDRTVIFGDADFTLKAAAADPGSGEGKYQWTSKDPTVAEIDEESGAVTIKGAGIVGITVLYESADTKGTAVMTLTVKPKSIAVPQAAGGLIWTGEAQTGVPEGEGYTLTGNVETKVGNFTAEASLNDPANTVWEDGTTDPKEIPWSIEKAEGPAAPTGLDSIAPTSEGGSDGKITGVTAEMEYSLTSDFSDPVTCTGTEITGLSAGTYYVRFKETATHKAGTAAAVTVPAYVPPEKVAAPVFSPAGGNYEEPQSVTISCAVEGAVIHYTTDGSEPTADSPIYTGPISVTKTTTVRAAAVKEGMTDSDVVSATFTIAKAYTVTVTTDGNGTASASTDSGPEGTEVTLTAVPKEGYQFGEWQVISGGVSVTDDKFTIGKSDVEIKAIFEKVRPAVYMVTVTTDGNGTASASTDSGPEGTEVTLTAVPKEGYQFGEWQVISGGVSVTDDKFTIGKSDVEIKAIFEKEPEPEVTVPVRFEHYKQNGMPMIPEDIAAGTWHLVLTISKDGKSFRSDPADMEIIPGNRYSPAAGMLSFVFHDDFDPQDLSSDHKYVLSGYQTEVAADIYSAEPMNPVRYKVTVMDIIPKNDSSGKVYLKILMKWDDGSIFWEPEIIKAVALPEDEIGAYKLNPDGTKEYLLFHTYDICMMYLGRDELCRGPERCYHK